MVFSFFFFFLFSLDPDLGKFIHKREAQQFVEKTNFLKMYFIHYIILSTAVYACTEQKIG